MSAVNLAIDILRQEEGFRERVYYCSEGYPTIGIGKRLGPKWAPLSNYQFTVSRALAEFWLREDVEKIQTRLYELLPYCHELSDTRMAVLISMAYQMGIDGLFGFANTLAAFECGDYAEAAKEMRDSKWFRKDTPERAERHARAVERDEYRYTTQ